MDPFPETQGIEEEVKQNKIDGDGEEGNKESEEVEEIGAPRDEDRDKGAARFDTPSGPDDNVSGNGMNGDCIDIKQQICSVEGKLDDIYIYIKPIARQIAISFFFLNPKTPAHAVHANRTLEQYNSRTTQLYSLPRHARIGFHQIERLWLAEQANGREDSGKFVVVGDISVQREGETEKDERGTLHKRVHYPLVQHKPWRGGRAREREQDQDQECRGWRERVRGQEQQVEASLMAPTLNTGPQAWARIWVLEGERARKNQESTDGA
ncbi:hypothetical protein BC835DRAFT_1310468 [Cytidiella melzeri]|nr:hypothetical protein BC835DRAFT_1310468 [Cytidiella melzeri]